MIFSQLDKKKVNPPSVPSAATKQTDSFNPVFMMIGVFLVVFTAGFSSKFFEEMRLLRSEVSLLRLAAEKIAGQS
jgi:hypothetical protein